MIFLFIIIVIIVLAYGGSSDSNRTNITTAYKPTTTYTRESEAERLLREQKQHQKQEEERLKAIKLQQEQEDRRREDVIRMKETERKKDFYKQQMCKTDWPLYQNVLSNNNINVLYHFTDRANLQSIKRYGALYSWYYCISNNIKIPMPGSADLSRVLDSQFNLHNYVRISFTRNHPMMFIALKQNRINNPVILEIDPEIVFWKNAKYANKNATRSDVSIGSEIDDFKRIRFDIVKLRNHFDLDDSNKPYFQAEVLILEKIPIEFVKNIDRL
ncbi:MAG: DarT ssDNA thymidine ADP-ribosyltransferase family protein [Acholeplasma sp.]|nr:DarT ssDNA thymidine ADP-ribosyltransferase family protein [Acholeplasma sp.]